MSDIRFRGDDDTIAQINTVTPGGTIGTETFTVTINTKTITYTATGGDVVADVVDELVAAFNASTEPEFAEITATDSTTHMTLTADSPGVPFIQTSSATGSATCNTATSTSNSSPSQLSAANCTGGSLPGAADEFYLENCTVALKYGLDQSSAGTLAKLWIARSMTGDVGLPRYNSNGYHEYRPRYYAVRASACEIGYGGGSGSGRILLDFGSVQTAVLVHATGSSAETDYYAVRLKGTHASNTLTVLGGTVDVAPEGGETATVATLAVSGSARVRTSDGVTLTTVTADGGSRVEIRSETSLSDITAITITGSATVTIYGDNAITTINALSGNLIYNATGTVTNLNVGATAVADFSQGAGAVTVTNAACAGGGKILDPGERVTWTNGIDLSVAGLEDVTLSLGKNITITPS